MTDYISKIYFISYQYHNILDYRLKIMDMLDESLEKIKIKCLNCKNHHLVESLKFHTEELLFNKKELELENMNKLKIMEKILFIVKKCFSINSLKNQKTTYLFHFLTTPFS